MDQSNQDNQMQDELSMTLQNQDNNLSAEKNAQYYEEQGTWREIGKIGGFEFDRNWTDLDIPECHEHSMDRHFGYNMVSEQNEEGDDIKDGHVQHSELLQYSSSLESIFAYGPLSNGFGITLGNSLRRILLSLIRGTAIVAIKIPGVEHEFSTIVGMVENVVNLVLNLRKIKFRIMERNKIKVILPIRGAKSDSNNVAIYARDIEIPIINGQPLVDILNPDQYICTVNKTVDLDIEIIMAIGRGYVTTLENKEIYGADYGTLYLDSVFTPVTRVSYDVTKIRTQSGMADMLTMHVQTNGVVTPKVAMGAAARIMMEQCKNMVYFDDLSVSSQKETTVRQNVANAEHELEINDFLLMKIEEMEFSQRASNCLKNENIIYVYQLVMRSEQSLLRVPNLGRKSLDEINAVLSSHNLHVGMNITKSAIKQIVALIAKKEENSTNGNKTINSELWS